MRKLRFAYGGVNVAHAQPRDVMHGDKAAATYAQNKRERWVLMRLYELSPMGNEAGSTVLDSVTAYRGT